MPCREVKKPYRMVAFDILCVYRFWCPLVGHERLLFICGCHPKTDVTAAAIYTAHISKVPKIKVSPQLKSLSHFFHTSTLRTLLNAPNESKFIVGSSADLR